jgi:hypothetical protein
VDEQTNLVEIMVLGQVIQAKHRCNKRPKKHFRKESFVKRIIRKITRKFYCER